MSLNRRSSYQYYRPQTTSVSTRFRETPNTPRLSIFHMFLYFFIGFFFMYVGLIYFFGTGQQEEQADAIALDGTPAPVVKQQETEQENSLLSFFRPQGSSKSPNTLGVNTKQDETLLKLIEEQIPKDNGEYAVVVKELGSGDEHQVYINHQAIFPAGSLYKLYVMAAALEKVEKGELTLETTVSAPANHLEEVLGGPDFGYEDRKGETISYTVEEILGRIARISDNYASIMLAEKLDWEYVRDYAKRMGAADTTIKSPISTNAKDTAYFFDQLYQKKIVSETASNKIISLLETAQLNQRIPAKLPKSSLRIAHKTGELPGVRHDAGIVYFETKKDKEATESATPEKAYLIVLMSKDLKGEDTGVAALADISKVVYDYFKQLQK